MSAKVPPGLSPKREVRIRFGKKTWIRCPVDLHARLLWVQTTMRNAPLPSVIWYVVDIGLSVIEKQYVVTGTIVHKGSHAALDVVRIQG